MTRALGDESRYPGFCGMKWGDMTQGTCDTHVLMEKELEARQGPIKTCVLATTFDPVNQGIDFKHYESE